LRRDVEAVLRVAGDHADKFFVRGADDEDGVAVAHQGVVELDLGALDLRYVGAARYDDIVGPVLHGDGRVESHEFVDVSLHILKWEAGPDLCGSR
jgi:hypothetical protein